LGNLKERDHLEDLGAGVKIILEWILVKWCGRLWTGCIWLWIGNSIGSFEHGKEPPGSIKGGECLG
jgi:hypothetical protein